MKRKIVWLLVTSLMALSLVITSCGQARTTQTTPTRTTAPTVPTTAPTPTEEKKVAAPVVEKPKYGGVLKIGQESDIRYFEEIVAGKPHTAPTLMITNETLWTGDWAKGPAGGYGTNETDWAGLYDLWDHKTSSLAERWDIPNKIEGDKATITYYIRKGVRWALNPDSEASRLVAGRELSADDIVFSLKQAITDKRAFIYQQNAELRPAKITAVDKDTVRVEIPWDAFASAVSRFGDYVHIVPPEVVQKYGDMRDWKNSVGTDAFMLTDFVAGSSATLMRNPNYWMKDPVGPGKGSQLPYMDGVRLLIIPDASTRYAALRTAKIDWLTTIDWDQAPNLKKTTPQLMSNKFPTDPPGLVVALRTDKKPFNDLRVRRALMMAIDFEGIKNNYYGGDALIVTWPIGYFKPYAAAYLGLDDPEMPASVRELYSFNPEKSKRLLAEAGYPNGFQTWLNFGRSDKAIDYYSILKGMWAKVGVEVELRPMESGAYDAMNRQMTYEQMSPGGTGASPIAVLYMMATFRGLESPGNAARVDDPLVNETFTKVQRLHVTGDAAGANRAYKELMKHVLDQAWVIPPVNPPQYTMWWPWLKNYNGEKAVGYIDRPGFYKYVWYDEILKKSLGY